ncbi:hypothetical protein AWC38_SpisGene5316 [Stylophora pistillata]|uniref:Uncharacterized protein n=1 Tax=Stylophora pistillata TaxID=50429 RepID=A0A2B4SMW6_STYPI|nr:hypothetical protein AWC38_SpisGene5316 [Stylophora pistillata]
MLTGTEVGTGVSSVIHINDYSSLQRLVRATAWVKRFLHNTRAKERRTGRLEIYELKGAESEWLKSVQVDLKKQDNFKQLVGEFGIKEHQEILRCEVSDIKVLEYLEYMNGSLKNKELCFEKGNEDDIGTIELLS